MQFKYWGVLKYNLESRVKIFFSWRLLKKYFFLEFFFLNFFPKSDTTYHKEIDLVLL